MNIPKDKLIRCAEGLGLRYYNDSVYIENWQTAWDSGVVPILLTYAPGGIMDKMGWMPEASWDGEHFFIIHSLTREHIVVSLDNKLNIPAAAIDAYLDTLQGNKTSDEYDEKLQHLTENIELMKSSLSMMEYELKKLKEGK